MLPLDGSRTAEAAVPAAAELAKKAGATLHVVRVVDWVAELTEDDGRDSPLRYFQRLAAEIPEKYNIDVRTELLTDAIDSRGYGAPPRRAVAQVLSAYAVKHQIDLTVMASHGRGGFKRMWLGSVADSMLRTAGMSILLVPATRKQRASAGLHVKRVLVPIDTSQLQEEVTARALEIGEFFGAEYILLHVAVPAFALVPAGETEPIYEPETAYAAAEEHLARLATAIDAMGSSATTDVIVEPFIGSAILRYADDQDADMIVLATRGPGRVERAVFGSVADKVVRGARVPVLACNLREVRSPR